MKVKRYNLIPAALLVYLGVMSYIGYPAYRSGRFSAAYYFGTIAFTIAVIIVLRIFLRKRDQYRSRREHDMKNR